MASVFFSSIRDQVLKKNLFSDDYFTVDGTLLEVWASMKRFRPKDSDDHSDDDSRPNPTVDFRGQKRTNDTHCSNHRP
jgi:hypothetical protein